MLHLIMGWFSLDVQFSEQGQGHCSLASPWVIVFTGLETENRTHICRQLITTIESISPWRTTSQITAKLP